VHGVEADELTDLRGTRLPIRRTGRVSAGRVLLVGDAAGHVDPLSGDGIHAALLSARLAADAILAGGLEDYERALEAALGRQTATSWRAKLLLDRHPRVVFAAVGVPTVWSVVAGTLTGELAHPSEAHGLARPPLRLLARL
jgi:flavin-dependent dehydrogenase